MTNLPTNWVDNIGMIEDAAFLNLVGTNVNANTAALAAIVSGTAGAVVATSQATTSASFTDLTTTTDTVTVTIGASGKALVLISAGIDLGAGGAYAQMSYALSGANTRAASSGRAIGQIAWAADDVTSVPTSGIFLETGLAAGSTVFKAKYAAPAGGSVAFIDRRISVIPFP